ncbi:MAG: basic secretory protein-like protein [Kofleriaceae bacterium]
MRIVLTCVVLVGCGRSFTPPATKVPVQDAPACGAGPDEVALFEHAEFRGRCAILRAGEFDTPEAMNIDNDAASSVQVGQNVRLLACRDRAFAGACEYLSTTATLDDTSVGNDALSSARVDTRIATGPTGCVPGEGQIALFEHADFAGACSVLGIGDFVTSPSLGIANDAASSVRVGPNTQALLCQDDGLAEPCIAVIEDVAVLADSDAVSSARVLPDRSACLVRGATVALAPHVATMEAYCARSYQRVLDVLDTEPVFAGPIVITFARPSTFTGEGRGRDVFIDDRMWKPSDLGMIDHELTHVVTMYPSAPSWITEGVADWVRQKLTGEPMACAAGETFADGYGCAATLLSFVERKKPGAVRRKHAELRTEAFDGRIAGRDASAWWNACLVEGTCRPR